MSFFRQRRALALLAGAARPFTSAIDALVTRVPGSHFRQNHRGTGAEGVSAGTIAACAPEVHGRSTLRVEYDARTAKWLLDRARNRPGRLLTHTMWDGRSITGWYICHLDTAGQAEAIQLSATPLSTGGLLDHLFSPGLAPWSDCRQRTPRRALRAGAVGSGTRLFHRRGPWMLINTNKPELLSSFHTGNSAFSRMDGEWSLRF